MLSEGLRGTPGPGRGRYPLHRATGRAPAVRRLRAAGGASGRRTPGSEAPPPPRLPARAAS